MVCALCKLEKPLVNSHVMPELLYKPLYDEKHRTALFESRGGKQRLIQKGLRERLLCDDCERVIQVYEDYFARYWYQTKPVPAEVHCRELPLSGIDYRLCKLFVLSIIWRASASRLAELHGGALGPHEERIRKMILNGDPGPLDKYQILAALIIDTATGEVWDELVVSPRKTRVNTHWASRVVFGGACWTVLTSSHPMYQLSDYVLTEAGDLRLPVLSHSDFVRGTGVAAAIRRSLEEDPANNGIQQDNPLGCR